MIAELKTKLLSLGLEEEMVERVLMTFANFAKEKAPSTFHQMIDDVMDGKNVDLSKLTSIASGLKGFFGR